jgi:hypothetical protein
MSANWAYPSEYSDFQVLHPVKDSDRDYGISPAADAGKPVEY